MMTPLRQQLETALDFISRSALGHDTGHCVHLANKAEAELRSIIDVVDALLAENAELKSLSIKLFNLGYLHGHESTVEGYFVDVHRNDIDTYHDDVVAEILEDEDETPATSAALAAIRSQAVDEFADSQIQKSLEHRAIGNSGLADVYNDNAMDAKVFAMRLREAAELREAK